MVESEQVKIKECGTSGGVEVFLLQGWEDLLEKKQKLEAEVREMEKIKRNWLTELDMITKEMDDLIKEQLKQQMEVRINLVAMLSENVVCRRCSPTTEQTIS